jgi:hypothetical protein
MANPEKQDPKQQQQQQEQQQSPTKGGNPVPAEETDPKKKCPPLTDPDKEPTFDPPAPYTPANCNCPAPPSKEKKCFDDLIGDQDKILREAERAKVFKAELEDLMKKADAAVPTYTREKFDEFSRRWADHDKKILAIIDTAICRVKCWRCFIECEVCRLLHYITDYEEYLDGGPLIATIGSLQDVKYWRQRNRDKKLNQFNRIKALITAWSNPAESLELALNTNEKLIKDVEKMSDTDAVFAVFMQVIPLHLAIKPRAATTQIKEEHQYICGKPEKHDLCCLVDADVLTATQLYLAGEPLAYIIDPNDYLPLICCLAKHRYLPAKDQLAKAESALAEVEATIARITADLDRRRKSILEDYRGSVSSPVKCGDYTKKTNGSGGADDCGDGPEDEVPEGNPEQTVS